MQRHGGISVVWGEILRGVLAAGLDYRCVEYRGALDNAVRATIAVAPDRVDFIDRNVHIERFRKPRLHIAEPAVFHSSYYRIVNSPLVSNVTTVHDFTYEHCHVYWRRKLHAWQKYDAIRKSKAVVCISENTRRDLLHFLPDVEPSKIEVIYNGVSDDYRPLTPAPERRGLLFVGARFSYKNFPFAVECARVSGKHLTVAGTPLRPKELKLLHERLGGNFTSVVYPDNEALNLLYNTAEALVYPSSYEGFGIPVVEAQRAACPVVALNASSIPEVAGADTLLLDTLSTAEFMQKMALLQNPREREAIVDFGLENSRRFSWHKMAREYVDLYRRLGV